MLVITLGTVPFKLPRSNNYTFLLGSGVTLPASVICKKRYTLQALLVVGHDL